MKYYYHGVGDNFLYSLPRIINFLKRGYIRVRQHKGDPDYMHHICLYKKNDEFDYTQNAFPLDTVRNGWIDNCAGYIIDPNLEAYHYEEREQRPNGAPGTNLVDEWRYDDNIPFEMIRGIFLPLDEIEEIKESDDFKYFDSSELPEEFKNMNFDELVNYIINFANSMNWLIINSNEPDFTDKLDNTLEENKGFSHK